MENKRLNLPIGIQTFEKLRKRGNVYVDKTKYLVELIDNGDVYFLARPRRFGKSLTVSTFDALFSGEKELFKGLYAEEFLNRPGFQPSPVIRLDMSDITTNMGIEVLESSMQRLTRHVARKLDVNLPDLLSSGELLSELIVLATEKYQQKVVILLDEYDKPYTDFSNNPDMAEKVRDVLRNFYSRIKANDQYIRFTFITGISKFAKMGVFSTLNTPLDISMMPKYAAICGYTEEEIIRYFPDYLDETAAEMQIPTQDLIKRMRDYYNGFSFDRDAKIKLYNPYSTLTFFANKQFSNYWIETGSTKFIADYMRDRYLTVEEFRNFKIGIDFACSPGDVDTTPPAGFFYQAGYLTLHPAEGGGLALDYPNTEVYNSMSKLVADNIFKRKSNDFNAYYNRLMISLESDDFDLFKTALNTLLASIPYDDYAKAAEETVVFQKFRFPAQEWLYRSCILSYLRGCGVVVEAELHTHLGRPDLVIAHNGKTWIIEIKVAYKKQSPRKKAEEALEQIIDRQYAAGYPGAKCIGLGIDDSLRQIKAIKTL